MSAKKNWGWSTSSLIERYRDAAVAAPTAGVARRADVRVEVKKTKGGGGPVVRVTESAEDVQILIRPLDGADLERDPRLRASTDARVRDAVGQGVAALERLDVTHAHFDFDLPAATLPAALLGLEIALYRYKRVRSGAAPRFALSLAHQGRALKPKPSDLARGVAVNLARHLVNLPANELNPETYADFTRALFSGMKSVTVEVWDDARLAKENCNLLRAVGRASATPPRLVRIRYRPARAGKAPPVALVGKGITFDSGGLDIKPAAGMRLMKKDMGGSAAVLAAIWWAAATNAPQPIEAVLALAENAIAGDAFRPGDVFTARNGLTVEITNTDAEGRLVLADALNVALEAGPRAVVDVATLTGAIKVALGAQIAGLFANDDRLAQALAKAGTAAGDPAWVMPLAQRYRPSTASSVADMVNSVESGFGGAITAALFLERFVGEGLALGVGLGADARTGVGVGIGGGKGRSVGVQATASKSAIGGANSAAKSSSVPWAHLDIYAWKDAPEGAWLEGGGSGQAVLLLTEWI